MMKTKQLEWRNQVNEENNPEGYFQIGSEVMVGGGSCYLVDFTIRNFKYWNGEITPNFYYLWVKKGFANEECFEFNTVEEAKQKAQEEFKKRILELFFEQ